MDGELVLPIVGTSNQAKTLVNTNDEGLPLKPLPDDENNNTVAQSELEDNLDEPITLLECWRPLIYEPNVFLNSMCNSNTRAMGTRGNRQVTSLLLSGSFRIRMIEGINSPPHWANHIQMVDHGGMEENGEIQYGRDGFASPQFVRCVCIVVHDMGKGYGKGQTTPDDSIQVPINPNYRVDDAAGVGGGAADTMNSHLLAPALGDIFDDVGLDPENNYNHVLNANIDYNNEDMIRWKYKKNSAATATPELGQATNLQTVEFADPLRGSIRRRKFHVAIDKTIQFQARGSQSVRVNQEGGRQHDFK